MRPAARLRRRADFRRLYQEGVSLANSRAVLYLLPVDGETRVGFVAGRKLGPAVVRNRAKRLLREAVRQHRDLIGDGYLAVFIARRGVVGLGYQGAEKAVLDLLHRVRRKEGGP